MKISEVLWKAANEHLRSDNSVGAPVQSRYSCDAVALSNGDGFGAFSKQFKQSPAGQFIQSLGCPIDSMGEFNEFEAGPERQGARYAWLMFASMVAEEQGL